MPIRKLLLPLTSTAAGEAALATALLVARRFNAHVTALHVRVDSRDVAPLAGEGLSGAMIEEMMSATEKESSSRAHSVRTMFETFVAAHDVRVGEARFNDANASASFAAVTGRERALHCEPRPREPKLSGSSTVWPDAASSFAQASSRDGTGPEQPCSATTAGPRALPWAANNSAFSMMPSGPGTRTVSARAVADINSRIQMT